MADDQTQREMEALKRKLNLVLYAQAEILVRLKQEKSQNEVSEEAIREEEERLSDAFANRPAPEMKGPGIRIF